MIRVGTRIGTTDPSYPLFEKVVVLMKSHSKWGVLGPYLLKTDEGHIFENVWQFSKVYETVPVSKQSYSRYDSRVIWSWPAERHMTPQGELLPSYWVWRKAGFECSDAVRYPVGLQHRHQCQFSLTESGERLDYVEARKRIYATLYKELVRKQPLYQELLKKLRNGINLLIVEVDGPKQESLPYYKQKYGVSDDWIQGNTILATKENLDIMANDTKHAYGHGYCLADALMEDI